MYVILNLNPRECMSPLIGIFEDGSQAMLIQADFQAAYPDSQIKVFYSPVNSIQSTYVN